MAKNIIEFLGCLQNQVPAQNWRQTLIPFEVNMFSGMQEIRHCHQD